MQINFKKEGDILAIILKTPVRCPSCTDMHEIGNFKGMANRDIVYFCKPECRKYYFSVVPTPNQYGEK